MTTASAQQKATLQHADKNKVSLNHVTHQPSASTTAATPLLTDEAKRHRMGCRRHVHTHTSLLSHGRAGDWWVGSIWSVPRVLLGHGGTCTTRRSRDVKIETSSWYGSDLTHFKVAIVQLGLGNNSCRIRKIGFYSLHDSEASQNGFILPFLSNPPLKIEGNCRNWCRNKDWRTTFVFLSPFLWHTCHLVQEAFCSLTAERKKNNESSASRPRFYFDPALGFFFFFLFFF